MPVHVESPVIDNYIVCGRGQSKYNSTGNKKLRNLVASHLSVYIDKGTTRTEKSKLVDKVTREIFVLGMVFVKRNKKSWEHLSYPEARAKVGHRFRDAARRIYSGMDQLQRVDQLELRGILVHLYAHRRTHMTLTAAASLHQALAAEPSK